MFSGLRHDINTEFGEERYKVVQTLIVTPSGGGGIAAI
jgi:hypothetical protein